MSPDLTKLAQGHRRPSQSTRRCIPSKKKVRNYFVKFISVSTKLLFAITAASVKRKRRSEVTCMRSIGRALQHKACASICLHVPAQRNRRSAGRNSSTPARAAQPKTSWKQIAENVDTLLNGVNTSELSDRFVTSILRSTHAICCSDFRHV